MQIEIMIRQILREGETPEQMAEYICKFTNLDKLKLISAIKTYGSDTNEQRNKIINAVCGKKVSQRGKT